MRTDRLRARILIPALMVAGWAGAPSLAQQPLPPLQGTWTATVGKSQVFRGAWTAALDPRNPSAAEGFWTLRNDLHEVVASGSWSARKTGTRWHGSWTARAENGQSYSGAWDAAVTDAKLKTFAGLLAATIEKEASGFWQSGRVGGNWWLDGEKPRSAAH